MPDDLKQSLRNGTVSIDGISGGDRSCPGKGIALGPVGKTLGLNSVGLLQLTTPSFLRSRRRIAWIIGLMSLGPRAMLGRIPAGFRNKWLLSRRHRFLSGRLK